MLRTNIFSASNTVAAARRAEIGLDIVAQRRSLDWQARPYVREIEEVGVAAPQEAVALSRNLDALITEDLKDIFEQMIAKIDVDAAPARVSAVLPRGALFA
jgi:hypothetical protein